jgi:hypothetical protein
LLGAAAVIGCAHARFSNHVSPGGRWDEFTHKRDIRWSFLATTGFDGDGIAAAGGVLVMPYW